MRIRDVQRAGVGLLGLWCGWSPLGTAHALETAPIAGEAARVEITESSSVLYNFDNRNTRTGNVATLLDDRWGTWYNRLNANGSWGAFRASLRLDSAWFYTSRSPADAALSMLAARNGGTLPQTYSAEDADYFVQKYLEAGDELSTRAVSWIYPAKYSLAYTHPNFELSLGDDYVQFGRGFVLSLRKQDELASDTTLRGVRVTARGKLDPARVRFTGVAGATNPLRIDEASGRFLGTAAQERRGLSALTEAGMPTPIRNDFLPESRGSFIPDQLVGGEFETRLPGFVVGLSAVHLQRGCSSDTAGTRTGCRALASDPARSAGRIDNASLALEFPQLLDSGALYAEFAHQWRADSRVAGNETGTGHALYASLNLNPKPFSIIGEFKHARAFYPLAANVDVTRAREFVPVQYSAAPTTEAVWNDTEFEHFGTCVTGGRLRADAELTPGASVFAWIGRYDTWGERATSCAPSAATLNRVWDVAQGLETSSRDRARKLHVTWGVRMDTAATPFLTSSGATSDVYYRELYLRYDILQRLPREFAVELQAWHRRRHQGLGGPAEPWLQGTTETGLRWGAAWSFIFGFEYDQNPGVPGTYFNGQVRYNLDSASNLSLFVGQRQGGQRCVAGVCRVFPPFEGARLDATLRF
jgi:hypothetical protein